MSTWHKQYRNINAFTSRCRQNHMHKYTQLPWHLWNNYLLGKTQLRLPHVLHFGLYIYDTVSLTASYSQHFAVLHVAVFLHMQYQNILELCFKPWWSYVPPHWQARCANHKHMVPVCVMLDFLADPFSGFPAVPRYCITLFLLLNKTCTESHCMAHTQCNVWKAITPRGKSVIFKFRSYLSQYLSCCIYYFTLCYHLDNAIFMAL